MKRNSNALTPAYPMEFTDQFNQKIIFGGLTKIELVALELYKQRVDNDTWGDFNSVSLIERCYIDAQQFCEFYIEGMIE